MSPSRRLAVGGIVGPAAFVSAWSVLGTGRPGYSPVHDPISRLAAVGMSSRTAMTAGFVVFGVGVAAYATALRRDLPGAAGAAAATAVATVGVAALPLGSRFGDEPHAVAAGLAYAALAAMPLLGARALAADGRRLAAGASVATGVGSGLALLGSALAPRSVGLLQRIGLTLGDAWIVATAVWLLRPRRPGH